MKQTIVISNYDDLHNPYYGGGGATAIHEIAKRLTKDYQVIVLTGRYPSSRDLTLDSVQYRRIGLAWFGPWVGQVTFQLALIFQVLTLRYDLWIESFTPPFSTSFTPLFTGRPVIALVHMLAAKDMERKYKLPFTLIENFGLKQYRHFIVLSKESAKDIKQHNQSASYLIAQNGINIPSAAPSTKGRNTILFLGRIEINQKGLDLLLSAYESDAKLTEAPLIIAGSGTKSELDALKNLVEQNKYRQYIRVIGKIEGGAKNQLLRHALVTVIPSRYETFSLTALEAMAYGSPIVCFDIKGMRWLDGTIASKAKPFNPKDFAQKIQAVLDNPTTLSSIQARGFSEAKKYNWDNIFAQYDAYIKKII